MEQFTAEEAIAAFSLGGVAKAGAKWDMDKLSWLNQQRIIGLDTADLAERSRPYFEAAGVTVDDRLEAVVGTVQARAKTLVDLVEAARFYFTPDDELEWDEKAIAKFLKPGTGDILTALAEEFENAPEWTPEAIEPIVKGFCEAREIGMGKVAQPIRVSMTGTKTGPGLYEMLVAAGKETAIRRIRTGAERSPPAES